MDQWRYLALTICMYMYQIKNGVNGDILGFKIERCGFISCYVSFVDNVFLFDRKNVLNLNLINILFGLNFYIFKFNK